MALSEYEQQMLEQLERQLSGEDPKLVQGLAAPKSPDSKFQVSVKHLVLGLLIAVLGLIVVTVGVVLEQIVIGLAGAVIVFLGFSYITATKGGAKQSASLGSNNSPSGSGENGAARFVGSAKGKDAAKEAAKSDSRDSFMQKQAQAWRQRKREQGM